MPSPDRRGAGLLLSIVLTLAAQESPQPQPAEPPVLKNEGKPMRVPFDCTRDDVESAGLACSADEPCPVYLEISAFESVGNRLFASGNLHSSAATLYSILLASDDAGSTWREPHERIRGAGLDHMQFVDFQNGWISGEILNPLPRDPFLLISSDGGKSWRQVAIFDESRSGAIQQFWFDSKTHGLLRMETAGDSPRYALYESLSGGDTWTVRETSERPIPIKRIGSGDDSGWRIRADAASHAFRIEKRQGEGWSMIAGFAVAAGECR